MNETVVKQVAEKWSKLLLEKSIPHVVFGSTAMLLHGCKPIRDTFKDVDLLVPESRKQEVIDFLREHGFTKGKHENYSNEQVTIGISTPNDHGFPCPSNDWVGTNIDGVRVMTLEGLIDTKKVAISNLEKKLKNRRNCRATKKNMEKQKQDLCTLCKCRDNLVSTTRKP